DRTIQRQRRLFEQGRPSWADTTRVQIQDKRLRNQGRHPPPGLAALVRALRPARLRICRSFRRHAILRSRLSSLMRFRVTFAFCSVAILSAWGVLRAQRPFQEYPAIEYENFPKPPDWNQKAEWVRARLRY